MNPASVTFDDGGSIRRNMPWSHFASADWDYSDPTTIRVEIGDWQVIISGHNLASLFSSIESAQLTRLPVHPEFANDPAHEGDAFATSIRFVPLASASTRRGREAQLRLPL